MPAQAIWLNDKLNTVYSEQRWYQHNEFTCQQYINKCTYFWGIKENESGQMIGTIAAHVDEPNSLADLGILIHHTHQKKGYGLEAWKAALEFLLNGRVRKVEAGCMSINTGMIKLCKRSEMKFEGERPGHFLHNSGATGLSMFGKT